MNDIPPMTDTLGRHWPQPNPDLIETDDTHALMSEVTFNQLADYSLSMPSGVYPGKIWKANVYGIENGRPVFTDMWLLRWYSDSGNPEFCNNNQREILICD